MSDYHILKFEDPISGFHPNMRGKPRLWNPLWGCYCEKNRVRGWFSIKRNEASGHVGISIHFWLTAEFFWNCHRSSDETEFIIKHPSGSFLCDGRKLKKLNGWSEHPHQPCYIIMQFSWIFLRISLVLILFLIYAIKKEAFYKNWDFKLTILCKPSNLIRM